MGVARRVTEYRVSCRALSLSVVRWTLALSVRTMHVGCAVVVRAFRSEKYFDTSVDPRRVDIKLLRKFKISSLLWTAKIEVLFFENEQFTVKTLKIDPILVNSQYESWLYCTRAY